MLACFIMLRHEERMGIHEKIGTLKMFQAKGCSQEHSEDAAQRELFRAELAEAG